MCAAPMTSGGPPHCPDGCHKPCTADYCGCACHTELVGVAARERDRDRERHEATAGSAR